jgi:sucrose-6F-phosphate phosphohydrolase
MDGRQLVVSDLDGTLLGDESALDRFADWYERVRDRVALVYASGRFCPSIRESVVTTNLPEPAAIIGGLGSQVRCFPSGGELFDWPTAQPPHWEAAAVRVALSPLANLELQPEEFQSDFKVSYFLIDATADDLRTIDAALRHYGLACEVVYSSREHLDVLPRGVNKGTAARQLARHWQLDEGSVIVCGDTANDLAMFQQGFRGIIVANARDELKQLAGENIYLARRSHAAGVLEGLRHWLGKM